jgi:prepilin-type N-terminal cleavage/methylation domain-containing protein
MNGRRGFTLFELLLVLAVLVILAGLAWPAFKTPFENQRLLKAGDLLRAAFGRARIQAMDRGVVQMFRYEPATGRYQAMDWSGFDSTGGTADPGMIAEAAEALPEGIHFVAATVSADTRSQAAGGDPTALASAPPIWFYPDGTASDAEVVLANDAGRAVTVQLRGLTGIARRSEVMPASEVNLDSAVEFAR